MINFTCKYGSFEKMEDITNICWSRLYHNDVIIIPSSVVLSKQIMRKKDINPDMVSFDINQKKYINIYINNNSVYMNEHRQLICIDFIKLFLYVDSIPKELEKKIWNYAHEFCEHKLWYIQSKMRLLMNNFSEEYPEQMSIAKYLNGDENVLELGGNVGRSSLIISYILNNNNNMNFVTLEPVKYYSDILNLHKNINNLNFHIENSALSKRKLLQKNWDTIASNVVLDTWEPINTITKDELYKKYNIKFDTLVIDCEGAFFQILLDMPEILLDIKLIIMENDYRELWKKSCVDYILEQNNFKRVEMMPLGFYIDWVVCNDNFYEIWKKQN
jgi:FkbM family methyltransferase